MDDPVTYARAGVDLDAAEASVAKLASEVERTRRPEVLGSIGGFGGLFAFDAARYRAPVLVSSADGVGTKVDLARRLGVYDGVGRDLVAMVVDDLVVTGAEPLFLNDYLAVGRLDPDRVATIVAGIADGCVTAGCALVGGETAEHPGLLEPDEFDLAGFAVGVVERDAVLGPHRVAPGDALVALEASGLHANGYSLVRHLLDRGRLDLDRDYGLGQPLGAALLEPTRIYARDCLALLDEVDVHALCHITGGGIPGNVPRVLGELGARVDTSTWERPALLRVVAEQGGVPEDEVWRTFNGGVGMLAVVAADEVDHAVAVLRARGVTAWRCGEVRAERGVALT